MPEFKQFIQTESAHRASYFQNAAQEIAETNLRLLRSVSILASILLIALMLITPFVIPGWRPSLQHLLFLPVSLLLVFLITRYQKSEIHPPDWTTGLCLLFEAILFLFIMAIDILQAPDVPASFMPMLCVSMPALLILPFRLHYGMILFFESIYIISTLLLKTPATAQYDIFNSIVGIAFSISLAQIMLRLRIQDYETRSHYQKLSLQDALSGLLNKVACQEAASEYLNRTAPNTVCALLVLDLDDFKQINDEFGHYTGDALLQTVGRTLAQAFRASDIVGRFGGDEFLILVKDTADYTVLEQKCCTIHQKLQEAARNDCSLQTTCSIGGVILNHQTATFHALFKQADNALYEAKAAGKNNYRLRYYQLETQ
ncbi:MAG: GGDEF domain-containing protein [Peptococcaceae bacterium]|nr:GGDEF domain-containing protein [Peptococcaceae bacterium]